MCDRHPPSASRRQLLAGAASIALTSFSMRTACAADDASSDAPPASNAISPDDALARLLDGNARYVANAPKMRDFSAGRAGRVSAQYPIAAIVSCADARVAPEFAFDQGPGDLFVVRVAGNFINDDGLASLEYGVKYLRTPLIVVLGHTNCGAVNATVNVIERHAVLPGHLGELARAIRPAVKAAKQHGSGDLAARATLENARLNAARLADAKPIVGRYVKEGKVKVVAAMYDLATGKVGVV